MKMPFNTPINNVIVKRTAMFRDANVQSSVRPIVFWLKKFIICRENPSLQRLQKNKNNGFKKKQECGNKNSGNKRHQNTQAEILSGFSFMKLPVFIRIILNGSRVNHRTKEIRDRKKGVIIPTAARPSMPTVLAAITDGEDFGPLPPVTPVHFCIIC